MFCNVEMNYSVCGFFFFLHIVFLYCLYVDNGRQNYKEKELRSIGFNLLIALRIAERQ